MCEDREALKAELKEELKEEFVSREEFERERERRRRTERALAEFEREAESERWTTERKATAALNKAGANKDRIGELQVRELEKGAFLRKTNVDVDELPPGKELADVTQDDGKHYYHDPHADGVDVDAGRMGWDDLLPIQQLEKMPDDQREDVIGTEQDRRAVWLWENRDDLMQKGSGKVDRYIESGDLQRALSVEYGIARSSEAAKRVMEAFRDATRNKTYIEKIRSKTGEERRLVIPSEAEIPGESRTDPGEPHNEVSA